MAERLTRERMLEILEQAQFLPASSTRFALEELGHGWLEMAEALIEVFEAEGAKVYLEGPDSDYGGPALRCRKAWQKIHALLEGDR